MADQSQPIDRLRAAIEGGFRPLLAALASNTAAVQQMAAYARMLLDKAGVDVLAEAADVGDVLPQQTAVPRSSAIDFDMESAIKAADKWECEGALHTEADGTKRQLRCTDCPIDINMDCLSTYGLLGEAERAIGKSSGDDDEARFALHRLLRGAYTEPGMMHDDHTPPVGWKPAVEVKPDVPVGRVTRRPVPVPIMQPHLSQETAQALAKAASAARESGSAAVVITPPAAADQPKKRKPRAPMGPEEKAKRAKALEKARAAKAMKAGGNVKAVTAKKGAPAMKKKGR